MVNTRWPSYNELRGALWFDHNCSAERSFDRAPFVRSSDLRVVKARPCGRACGRPSPELARRLVTPLYCWLRTSSTLIAAVRRRKRLRGCSRGGVRRDLLEELSAGRNVPPGQLRGVVARVGPKSTLKSEAVSAAPVCPAPAIRASAVLCTPHEVGSAVTPGIRGGPSNVNTRRSDPRPDWPVRSRRCVDPASMGRFRIFGVAMARRKLCAPALDESAEGVTVLILRALWHATRPAARCSGEICDLPPRGDPARASQTGSISLLPLCGRTNEFVTNPLVILNFYFYSSFHGQFIGATAQSAE